MERIEVGGIYYEIINGTDLEVSVIVSGTFSDGQVLIPQSVSLNGKIYKVTRIRERAFLYRSDLTSIFNPNSVTTI